MKALGSTAAFVLIGVLLFVGSLCAQTETNLHMFRGVGVPSDGGSPTAGLAQGADGNFYGTTSFGGPSNGGGIVFRISPSGTYTTLYAFVGNSTDGSDPQGVLLQGTDGNFYGTTYLGGTVNSGTVFRISPSGSYTSLYSFAGPPNDGANPAAGLLQGNDGNFYGTAFYGGTNNEGTVFRISPSGSYTSLYSFAGPPNDGSNPQTSLVQGSDSNFYGTTYNGGTNNEGTVFRISPSGSYTSLYAFVGPPSDGSNPRIGMVQGSDGNLYGTTYYGGMYNEGTVFRISSSGSYTSLYSFAGPPNDGNHPQSGLVQGSDGNFYGTTLLGGTSTRCIGGCGTLFWISPSGKYTNIYSFVGAPLDGHAPAGAMIQDSEGTFYGTTISGGIGVCGGGCGTVFKLTIPLNPPANHISAVQVMGNDTAISIPSVAGETYQLQFTTDPTSGIWSNVASMSVSNCIGSLLTLTNYGGALLPQGFYRFAITP